MGEVGNRRADSLWAGSCVPKKVSLESKLKTCEDITAEALPGGTWAHIHTVDLINLKQEWQMAFILHDIPDKLEWLVRTRCSEGFSGCISA